MAIAWRCVLPLGPEVALSALYSARSRFSRSFFPSCLAISVLGARTTAIVHLELSSCLGKFLTNRSWQQPTRQWHRTFLRRQITTSLHRQAVSPRRHIIRSNRPSILLRRQQLQASLLWPPMSLPDGHFQGANHCGERSLNFVFLHCSENLSVIAVNLILIKSKQECYM